MLPYGEYLKLLELAEGACDAADAREAMEALTSGKDEVVPAEIVGRLLAGRRTPVKGLARVSRIYPRSSG